nr:MAG TPA: hypothetical protein [Caudoviricetes sp.]
MQKCASYFSNLHTLFYNHKKAENDVTTCRCVIQKSQFKLRQKSALQRQPIPYAQPPRNLYKGNG